MAAIQNIFQQNNPYEKFVQQLVQLESRQKLQFESQQKDQKEIKTALGTVSESISKFISKLDELKNPDNSAFQPIKTSSSDKSVVTVDSASSIDQPSNFNMRVDRLASYDTNLGQVKDGEAFDLSALGNGSVTVTIGDKTETIAVDTQKDDGTGVMVDKNNREILESFATTIGETFKDQAKASVFNVSGDQVQLSVQSLETGFDSRVQFSGATGALADITGTMTKLVPENELNASFTIDGVTFERNSNTVDDAVKGLTFTMLSESTDNVNISAQRNLNAARANVNEFIDSFNFMNKKIRDRTFVDGDNNSRGPLREMRSIRNLTLNLRQTALLGTNGAAPGQISRLADIGISFENNGEMVVDDANLLNEALEQRPEEIEALFSSEDSAIASMRNQAEVYTKSNGIISTLENGVDQKLSRLDTRITQQERYLEQFEERQRDTFNKLQQVIDQGDVQFQKIMSFRNSMGF